MRQILFLAVVTCCLAPVLYCVLITVLNGKVAEPGTAEKRQEKTEISFKFSVSARSADNKLNNNNKDLNSRHRKRHYVPKFMMELYEASKSGEAGKPEVVKSVIPTRSETEKVDHQIIFQIPSHEEDDQFVGAEIRFLTFTNSKDYKSQEKILKIAIYDHETKILHYVKERRIVHINRNNTTWIAFNVTKTVRKLLASNSKTIQVNVNVTNAKISLNPNPENAEHDYPILLLSYSSSSATSKKTNTSGAKKRTKRNTFEEEYEEETNKIWTEELPSDPSTVKGSKKLKRMKNLCRRKSLYIDFAEIDYDTWIVQPPGYEAYQCIGKCFYPVAAHLSPTKHAIMQALLHSVAPSRAPRSCCVPTRLDSISVLYLDSRGILTYRYGYKDMVVTECGCR